MMNKKTQTPTTEKTIETILNNIDINWIKVYTSARKNTIDSYSRNLHFKLNC